MKTRKALKLRFRVTASGQLKRSKRNRRHILSKKTAKRKRQLRQPGLVSTTQLKMYKKEMGV